jgi:ribonuclease P protein component
MGKEERVRSPADFDRLRRDGRRGGDDLLRVLVAKNGLLWPRLGCAISRKVGPAVVRNRLRRLYGAAFRAEKGNLPPVDVLLTPTRGAEDPTLEAVRGSLVRLVTHAASKLPPGPPSPPPPRESPGGRDGKGLPGRPEAGSTPGTPTASAAEGRPEEPPSRVRKKKPERPEKPEGRKGPKPKQAKRKKSRGPKTPEPPAGGGA